MHDDLEAIRARCRLDFLGARREKRLGHETQRVGSVRRVRRAERRPRDLVHVDVRPELVALIAQPLLPEHVLRRLQRLRDERADLRR